MRFHRPLSKTATRAGVKMERQLSRLSRALLFGLGGLPLATSTVEHWMPSTISRRLSARIPNAKADQLERLAASTGRTVSSLIAEAVEQKLRSAQHITAGQ